MGDMWMERLSDFFDDELSHDDRSAVERHLQQCRDCRETLADLQRVRLRAEQLEDSEPDADLWVGIAERITGPDIVHGRAGRLAPGGMRRRFAFSVPQLAAAGVALMLVSGGAVQLFHSSRGEPIALPDAADQDPAPVVMAGFDPTDYDLAIAQLERVLEGRRDELAPATIRILEQNLAVIDQAIVDARAALVQDPSNGYVNGHLVRTMRQKVRLLRRAVNMISVSS